MSGPDNLPSSHVFHYPIGYKQENHGYKMTGMKALAAICTPATIVVCLFPLWEARHNFAIKTLVEWNPQDFWGINLYRQGGEGDFGVDQLFGFVILAAIHRTLEVTHEPLEVIMNRLWWQKLW